MKDNPFENEIIDPIEDIAKFHTKFGLKQTEGKTQVGKSFSPEEWELRHKRLKEECDEYLAAVAEGDNAQTLDALVDIVYIAMGTAYRRGWDFGLAWMRVHAANMEKERGEEHNSKYGSSFDIVKPEGWEPPELNDLV